MSIKITSRFYLIIALFHTVYFFSQNNKIEEKITEILNSMTIEEKIRQTNLKGTSSRSKGLSDELKELVRKGHIGAILNLTNPVDVLEIQKIAIEESPNHIPLLFGRDVIHGYKTIFPIPLGLAASWDLDLVEKTAKVAASAQDNWFDCNPK